MPVVEKRKEKKEDDDDDKNNSSRPPNKKFRRNPPPQSNLLIPNDSKPLNFKPAVPAHNFAILAKIVTSMKERYLNGDSEALTFDELLDETNQLDLSAKQKQWLLVEALPNNPRIRVTENGRYAYRAVFQLRDKKSLLRLLDRYDARGMGCISYDDVKESMPNAERLVKQLVDSKKIIMVTRPVDKKKMLFYNDLGISFEVDEEFQKAWRSISVEGSDESKIEDYLKNHGISSMQDLNVKKSTMPAKRKDNRKRKNTFKKLNNHLGNELLQDYGEK